MFAGLKIMSTFATQMRNKLTQSKCPDGGIGRRVGLKHQWIHFHPGSIPGLGTELRILTTRVLSFFSIPCLIKPSTVGLSHHFIQKAQIMSQYVFRF